MPPKNLILYGLDVSPPTRCVLLTARALGVTLDYKFLNIFEGEHMTPDFLKNNPQHTIPTLNDNGFIIWDSHAIVVYLATKYGPRDNSLYPNDHKTRACINQKLHFDSGILFARLRGLLEPIFFYGHKELNPDSIKKVYEGYDFLEAFLNNASWLVGDTLTIADLSCFSTVSSLETICEIQSDKYPNITAWLNRCKALPYSEELNQPGVEAFHQLYISKT